MSVADAVFNAADANQDNRLDLNEFRNLVGAGGVATTVGATDLTGLGAAGGYSSYQSSSYESGAGLAGAGYGGAGYGGAGYGGAGYSGAGLAGASLVGGGLSGATLVGGGLGGASAYESYSSSVGNVVGGDVAVVGGGVNVVDAGLSTANLGASQTLVQQYETDAQGLFRDHNPQVIRRPAVGGGVTYTQNIRVRFLQPPPVPPHGPLVIKEVRPAQPPPPPPLRLRQQAPPLPTPPPLVLRERPPVPPVPLATQTVVRRLQAVPVPPRSVIIERLPALPPRPRDIVLERWVQYAPLAARRTLVQRAGPAVQYARPRNVIIQYEQPQARIVRQFQRLGVHAENPALYVQRYGLSLLDAQTLVQQARAAGVVEDISPPAPALASASYVASSGDFGLAGGEYVSGGLVGLGGSSYQASSVSSADAAGLGFGLAGGEYVSGGLVSGGLVGSEVVSGGLVGGDLVGAGLGGGVSSYESSSYSTSGGVSTGAADALFNAADVNRDGVLSQAEFRAAF